MSKKVIQESYYTPKLNLKFEPPITNDSFGVSKVDKILNLIDNLYPNTKWWYGGKPSEYNPFLHPVDDEDDDSGYPEEICNFIIGHRDDFPNRITYGLYCDDSYGNEIDGYKWLQDNETNYDETEGMFNQLNESVEFDLGNYYQSKTLFYEIGKSGEPIKHDDIVGDDLGDLLYVGKRDGQYLICYYILIDNQKYEECVGGQKLLLKALMNREIVPVPYDEVGDPFNQLNENESDRGKVVYVFEPPIEDSDTLKKVLDLLNLEFSGLKWINNESVLTYDIYSEVFRVGSEDNTVGALSIGHFDEHPDLLSWSSFFDPVDYGNYTSKVDGWLWMNGLLDFDTYDVFNQLNEDIDEDDVPKITYVFEPPIEGRETLESVLYAVGNEHPNITWPTGAPILSYDVYREIFIDNEGYDFVNGLSIFPNESGPDTITWTSWVDPRGSYSDYGPKADGWQLLEKTTNLDTNDIFNQLNESTYQPKLNLRFDEPIYDADELDKILQVLAVVYPGLTWLGVTMDDIGLPITNHNVIRDQEHGDEDFYYDPIYYLTIGFFSGKWDKLTYTSGIDRDISYADDEHHNFKWVDGYKWVRDNQINYDETDDMFQQLNESSFSDFTLEYDENNPLHKFDIFLDKTNTASDIKYILDLYKEFGIPSSKKNEWNNSDIDYCHEWFLDPKKDGQGMVIGTGVNASGYYIYWEGVKDDRPKVRSSMGTDKELITFNRFLELTNFEDDNIFG